eukprot:6224103-Amphidinium_carterae.1
MVSPPPPPKFPRTKRKKNSNDQKPQEKKTFVEPHTSLFFVWFWSIGAVAVVPYFCVVNAALNQLQKCGRDGCFSLEVARCGLAQLALLPLHEGYHNLRVTDRTTLA